MILVEPQSKSTESKQESRCFLYWWDGDELVSQFDVQQHAAIIAEAHGIVELIEFTDDHPAELFTDRPSVTRLMETVREGDHLVVAPTSISVFAEWYAWVNRWTRAGIHVHVVDAVLCETYEMASEPNMFDAMENHLFEILRGAPHGFSIH